MSPTCGELTATQHSSEAMGATVLFETKQKCEIGTWALAEDPVRFVGTKLLFDGSVAVVATELTVGIFVSRIHVPTTVVVVPSPFV